MKLLAEIELVQHRSSDFRHDVYLQSLLTNAFTSPTYIYIQSIYMVQPWAHVESYGICMEFD